MHPETGIIIRTRNEERWLGETLQRLQQQTYQNFEIIIVDSGSTDRTLEIARKFPAKIVNIKASDFTYPYAINVGINNCTATKYYVILSAHSLPIGSDWLAVGVGTLKAYADVCGLYGPVMAMPDGSFLDKLVHGISNMIERYILLRGRPYRILYKYQAGALGFTNAIIRKDLYEQHPIDEAYAGGGEDTAWLQHYLEKGYGVIKHSGFAVHHSHYLGVIGWYKQWRHWKETSSPHQFTYLSYRNDGAHQNK